MRAGPTISEAGAPGGPAHHHSVCRLIPRRMSTAEALSIALELAGDHLLDAGFPQLDGVVRAVATG